MPSLPKMQYDAVCHRVPLSSIEEIGNDKSFLSLLESGYTISSYMVGSIEGSPHMFFLMVRGRERSIALRLSAMCFVISMTVAVLSAAIAIHYL